VEIFYGLYRVVGYFCLFREGKIFSPVPTTALPRARECHYHDQDTADRVKEADLVAVIEGKEEAGGARYIEFRVYQSPTEPDRVTASWRFPPSGTAIEESEPGNSIEAEFRFAVECADQHAIPFVWVNDPDELFPPWVRPK
jgi:hypothetical protein